MCVVNAKLIFNAKPTDIVTNTTNAGIDGFCIREDEKWHTFRRSKPFHYSMKTAVSFNRYAKFYETADSGSMKYWMLETQLTEKIIKKEDNTSKLFFLLSNIRTLVNMIPGKIRY